MQFSRMWTVARHEYLVNVRRPGFLIVTALLPLLGGLALLIGTFFSGQASTFFTSAFAPPTSRTGVVDQSGRFTPLLSDHQERYLLFADEAQGREALRQREIPRLLIIPSDYFETGRVTLLSGEGSFSTAAFEDSARARRFFLDHLLQGVPDDALRRRLQDPLELAVVNLDDSPSAGDLTSTLLGFAVSYVLGVVLIITIFVSSGYLLRSVVEEKTNRVIEVVLSSITAQELLAGKVLGLGALGLTQVVVWLTSAVALSGGAVALLGVAIPLLARPQVFALAVVYYLLGFLIYAVLMGSVGALGTSMQESQQLAGIFSTLASVPLFFAGILVSNPNAPLARVLSWFPLTAPTMMIFRLPMADVPMVDLIGSIAVTMLSIPLILWAGAKVFRLGLLMYGKRPSVAEVLRHLRTA